MVEPSRPEPPRLGGRYPAALRVLHWSIALLFGAQVALILVFHQLQSVEMGRLVLAGHRMGGLALFGLVAARIAVSPWLRPPSTGPALPSWQRMAAAATHGLMIAALVGQPLLGMAVAWSRGDAVTVFGLIKLPQLFTLAPAQAAQVELMHKWLAYGLMALLALHLGAVAFNHLVRRVSVIQRILAAPAERKLVNRVPVAAQLAMACGAILALTTAAGLYGAGQYRTFKDLQARFDETEVAVLDDLRAAQVEYKGLAARLDDPAHHAEAVTEAREAAETLAGFPDRLQDQDARVAAREAASAAARVVLADRPAVLAPTVDAQLQVAVDSQSARVFQGRLAISQTAAKGHVLIILALCPTLLLGAILAFLLSRSILDALEQMRRVVRAVERGEALERIEVVGSGDFSQLMRHIGRMRDAVEARQQAAAETRLQQQAEAEATAREQSERAAALHREERQAEMVDALGQGLHALARGDLSRRIERPFESGYEQIRIDFNAALSVLESLIAEITATADLLGANADEVLALAGELATRNERQAQGLGESTASLDDVTRRVEEAAEAARGASEAVGAARREAEGSGQMVSETSAAMTDIERSSEQIADIIGVVDELAFQTRLLALNAAVEAGRAGDAGRGFQIIAQEVRSLADRSGAAAGEIKELISGSRRKVALGVSLVGRTGGALRRVSEEIGGIDALVGGIARASAEQAHTLSDVNGALNKIERIVSQNAGMAEETSANAENLRLTADRLDTLVKRFARPTTLSTPRLVASRSG